MDMNASVKGVARTLAVFEAFADLGRPATLSELARHVGVPVSSCHGLVRTLEDRGYLYGLGARRGLYPTRRLLDIAAVIVRHDPLLGLVGPALERLRAQTGETVILGKRQGDRVVYLEVLEGSQSIRYTAAPGATKPLHSSAIGKAMLAETAVDLDAALKKLALSQVTPRTITDPARLRRDLRDGLRRGYFVTRGENVADVMALAVVATVGEERLGIAVAGPLQRMDARVEACVAALRICGAELQQHLQ